MTTIVIKDLEVCEALDRKSLGNVRGGADTTNLPARGILQSKVVRKANLGVYVNQQTGRLERKVQSVIEEVVEKAGSVIFEPVML